MVARFPGKIAEFSQDDYKDGGSYSVFPAFYSQTGKIFLEFWD